MYCLKDRGKLKRRVNIWLLCVLILFLTTGCRKTTSTNEISREENIVFGTDESDEKREKNFDRDDKSTDTTTIVETEETSKQTAANYSKESNLDDSLEKQNVALDNSNKNNTATPSVNANAHVHNYVKDTQTIHHQEKGHYETKVIQEAYDEEVYAWRTFCNKCGEDITDTDVITHSAIICESGYHNDYVVVDTIHHDAETKQVWVIDSHAYTEVIITYQCECGAVRNNE